MELVKNIFFNTDKLIQNSNIKISYTGELFNNNSEEVYIHYGFGPNWENVNELKMNKEEKKQLEEYEELRQDSYRAYVADQKSRIAKVADIQRRIIKDENPEAVDCLTTARYVYRDLWERMPQDSEKREAGRAFRSGG